jgi:hypothetical protein
MSENEKKGVMAGVGGAADHVVGDLLLGSLGRAGYHLSKVKPIADAGRYVKENVQDGFAAAELADFSRNMVKEIVQKTRSGESGLSPADFRATLERQGVAPEVLDDILERAEKAVSGKNVDWRDMEVDPAAPQVAATPA